MYTALLLFFALLFGQSAHAHFGNGLLHFHDGLLHPLTGLDHLAAAVAVGIWSTERRGLRAISTPGSFLGGMSAGIVAGSLGWFHGSADAGILLSVGALGAILFVGRDVPVLMGCFVAGAFGCLHGIAHGSEVGFGLAPGALAGLLLSTGFLHAAGYFSVQYTRDRLPKHYGTALLRTSGAVLMGVAALLAV